ncbi:MAG: YjbH domain-containing protein [Bacteroidetes bacterium]|nr:YjbH domain-containing protein [Bacteroidota bacterium]
MKNLLLLITLSLIISSISLPQGTAGEKAKYEYKYLIDMPSAGVLEKGIVNVTADIMQSGVVIAYFDVGVFENLSFGISYGGSNIIGTGSIDWYKWPGINVRARILNETATIPALTLGFDSQGKGVYFDGRNRYAIKSPGFFAATSKNFALWGFLALHATSNYSLENSDGDNFVNLMVGLEKTVGSQVSFILEYNFALNDNNGDFGDGKGYLNAGLRWSVGNGFTLELDFRDMLENSLREDGSPDRGLRINYIQAIF